MNYVSKILQPKERVLGTGRLHWIIYMEAVIFFALAIALWIGHAAAGNQLPFFYVAAVLFLVLSIYQGVAAWFKRWTTEIAVTNLRVIFKRGFVRRQTVEMNMDKVESVEVTQSILGRLLGYGSVHIRGTGEGLEHLHRIAAPVALRNCITAR